MAFFSNKYSIAPIYLRTAQVTSKRRSQSHLECSSHSLFSAVIIRIFSRKMGLLTMICREPLAHPQPPAQSSRLHYGISRTIPKFNFLHRHFFLQINFRRSQNFCGIIFGWLYQGSVPQLFAPITCMPSENPFKVFFTFQYQEWSLFV